MATKHETPTRKDLENTPGARKGAGKDVGERKEKNESPGRTIESPGQPGLEKEPNRDKAVGPGGQRLTSTGGKAAGRDIDVPGVDRPDGINAIDPMGDTKADEDKLL